MQKVNIASLSDHGYTVEDVVKVLAQMIKVPEHELGFTEIRRTEALKLARETLDDAERTDAVMEALTAVPREDFLKPPKPYRTIDVFPWRNNRELSYLRKPLIVVPAADGDRLVYGRGACFGAVEFLVDLAVTGRLGAEGSALREASILVQQREAENFEGTVADVLIAAGWKCRRRVKKLMGVRLARENGEDLGDVDVLAAHPGQKILACFEAKALSGALAPNQLRNELDATFAPANGRGRSAAVKFVERTGAVRANLSAALELMVGDGNADGWRVGMAMITDQELLSPLLDRCPAPVLSIGELRELLTSGLPLEERLSV